MLRRHRNPERPVAEVIDAKTAEFMCDLAELSAEQVAELEVLLLGSVFDFGRSAEFSEGSEEYKATGLFIACLSAVTIVGRGGANIQNETDAPTAPATRRAVVEGAHELASLGAEGFQILLSRMMPALIDQAATGVSGNFEEMAYWTTYYFLLALTSGASGAMNEAVAKGLNELLPPPEAQESEQLLNSRRSGFDGEDQAYEWVYAIGDTGIILLPRVVALAQASLREVLESATWGELRANATPDQLAEILGLAGYGTFERYAENLDVGRPPPGALKMAEEDYARMAKSDRPSDQDAFDVHRIPANADGDWPPDPRRLMYENLPDEVANLGRVYETNFNGTFVSFTAEQQHDILSAMANCGYRCAEDSTLIDGLTPS